MDSKSRYHEIEKMIVKYSSKCGVPLTDSRDFPHDNFGIGKIMILGGDKTVEKDSAWKDIRRKLFAYISGKEGVEDLVLYIREQIEHGSIDQDRFKSSWYRILKVLFKHTEFAACERIIDDYLESGRASFKKSELLEMRLKSQYMGLGYLSEETEKQFGELVHLIEEEDTEEGIKSDRINRINAFVRIASRLSR